MNRLVIVGAGGHGKVVADSAQKNGYENICYVDDRLTGYHMGFPIIGNSNDLRLLDDGHTDFVLGIGNNEIRKTFSNMYNINWATIIHPSAQIASNVSIGKGTVVMAGAVINSCVSIGNHCIINTNAVVEHDNLIQDYVHISPGAKLGGAVRVGELSHIGIGATIINNVSIDCGCIIGAGSVVIRDVIERGTYVGVPIRRIK